ncbi:MAG TPA: DUF2243 domain-containing protein [Burkholderiaceae bacterium]|nr:DUF2243 domain-containing protein [Burkholderiaceae bacterium]
MSPHSRAGFLLGFSAGGFFDGIVLHQILQWHHLLSALDREPFLDPRVQIAADGMFHAAMYVIALVGLYLLIRARQTLDAPGATRQLLSRLLIGFGAWHALDAVLSHWLLGIHRIRMDSAVPLAWDVGWLVVFGVVPLGIGFIFSRRTAIHDAASRHGKTLGLFIAGAVVTAMWASLQPMGANQNDRQVAVVLRNAASASQLLKAVGTMNARLIDANARGDVWVLKLNDWRDGWRLYRHGAVYVSGALVGTTCATQFTAD